METGVTEALCNGPAEDAQTQQSLPVSRLLFLIGRHLTTSNDTIFRVPADIKVLLGVCSALCSEQSETLVTETQRAATVEVPHVMRHDGTLRVCKIRAEINLMISDKRK